MLPIILTPKSTRVGLVGQGTPLGNRLRLLTEAGIGPQIIVEDRMPATTDLAGLDILFVAGFEESASREAYANAKASGVLVNVEDAPKLCDFHVPAQIRRGELLITVSTAGRSPGLAARVRETLGEMFGPEWGAHVDEVAISRARWRASGLAPEEVAQRTRDLIDSKGWLARVS